MKSYTDIEQSRKLAEFLPIESADQTWARIAIAGANLDVSEVLQYRHNGDMPFKYYSGIGTPCWSLAALLNYLREIDFFPNIEADEHSVTMNINYYNEEEARPLAPIHNIKVKAESFIDACYEMIIKLHELNLL